MKFANVHGLPFKKKSEFHYMERRHSTNSKQIIVKAKANNK